MSTIVFIYELGHMELLYSFLSSERDTSSCVVVALDAEVEHVLTERGVAFESGGVYRSNDAQPMLKAEEWTEKLLGDARWSFFTYRGVSFPMLYFHPLQSYLLNLLYYADLVANANAAHPAAERLVVFPSQTGGPAMGSSLVAHQITAVLDAVRLIGEQSGKEVIVVGAKADVRAQSRPLLFTIKRTCFGVALSVLNVLVHLLQRPRTIHILASDFWKNLVPYIQNLDTEVVLLDRTEVFAVGFRNIWKYRMRFIHLDESRSNSERAAMQEHYAREREVLEQESDPGVYQFRGYSFWPLLQGALGTLIENASEHALAEVDSAYTLLATLKPDIVLLRSTISTQRHFFILAAVARACSVPSLEMQHGLEYYGPGSVDARHSAEYMGVYGPLTAREMQAAGDKQVHPVVVGSPRFDVYASAHAPRIAPAPNTRVSVLCIAPPAFPGLLSTYDGLDYFEAVASAVRHTPNLSVLIKIRPGVLPGDFVYSAIATIFKGLPYTIAQREPLWDLYPNADIVVTHYSTTALEALMSRKPLVYLGLSPAQRVMGEKQFGPYVAAGIMRVARSREELLSVIQELATDPALREQMGEKSVDFIDREYAFDGHASERATELIRTLVKK